MNGAADRKSPLGFELFFGEASPAAARVFARFVDPPEACCRLEGFVRGPHCQWSHTLPATIPFRPRGGGDLLVEALVPDPCYWTPELPYWYDVVLALRRGPALLAEARRMLGIRPLGVRQGRLLLDAKAWVARVVSRSELAVEQLELCRQCGAAVYLSQPADDLCEAASRVGVLLVAEVAGSAQRIAAELERLSRWPAVAMAAVDEPPDWPADVRRRFPNLLLAEMLGGRSDVAHDSPADLAIWDLSRPDAALQSGGGRAPEAAPVPAPPPARLPLLALRRLTAEVAIPTARAACDRLQRDLAGRGEFVGYIV